MSAHSETKNRRGVPAKRAKAMDVHVVSDATCGLARHILNSVLTQFGELEPKLCCHPFCDTEEKLQTRLNRVRPNKSLVFSALASTTLKNAVKAICASRRVPHFDLTGGCVEFIEQHTGWEASNDIDAIHKHDTAYFDRIDALEFSLQHDDSRRLESINHAEIVLVGISRVSKTPTSAYLGWLGYRVANVSIVPGTNLPEELRSCRAKSVGLTMRPKKLAEIRRRRFQINGFREKLGADDDGYTDLRLIIREVMQAERAFRQLGIPIVDTSELTIEEIGTKVLSLLGRG